MRYPTSKKLPKFWSQVMGFEETDRNEIGMVFFRCGPDHHAIGLKPGKAGQRPEMRGTQG